MDAILPFSQQERACHFFTAHLKPLFLYLNTLNISENMYMDLPVLP